MVFSRADSSSKKHINSQNNGITYLVVNITDGWQQIEWITINLFILILEDEFWSLISYECIYDYLIYICLK